MSPMFNVSYVLSVFHHLIRSYNVTHIKIPNEISRIRNELKNKDKIFSTNTKEKTNDHINHRTIIT